MALKSTIFKVALNVADIDRNVYDDFSVTIARHPSETDERMMLRVLAFAMHADERLEFGKGLSTDDEPALWRRSLTNDIELWVDLGTPNERRLRKACGRSGQVILYAYGGRTASIWWEKNARTLARLRNLQVFEIDMNTSQALAALVRPTMNLQCTVQDGVLSLSAEDGTQVSVMPMQLS